MLPLVDRDEGTFSAADINLARTIDAARGIIALFPPGAGGGYDPASYRVAFAVILAIQLACFALYLANRKLFRTG